MPICESCKNTLVCKCGAVAGPQCEVVGNTVLACQDKAGIWVRVRDHLGVSVPGVTVSVSGAVGKTGKTGFATYDDVVAATEHTVKIALEGKLAETWKIVDAPLKGTVAKGEVKLFSFVLAPRAKPVVTVPKAAVAYKGFRQKILLTADAAYAGKGVFTCTAGADKVKFYAAGVEFPGTKTFDAITEAEITVEVEARSESAFEGVKFSWKIDDSVVAATGKITAVKAVLTVYKKAGTALSDGEKIADGRTIHKQNPAGERTRAKAEIEVLPAEFKGHVLLTLTKPTVTLYDKDNLGTAADLTLKIATGAKLTYFIEGVTLSTGKADTALEVTIDDLSGVVDSCNLTVMETKLQICEPRTDPKIEPAEMAEDRKFAVGRKLLKYRTTVTGQRALLRVTKSPLDAPCRLILRAPAGRDKVTFYEATGSKTYVPINQVLPVTEKFSHENRSGAATAMTLPREIAVDEVKDLVKGLVFWMDAAVVSTDREVRLQVDAEDVDDLCDTVACTVAKVKLHIEVKRTDKPALDDAVDFKLTAPGLDAAIVPGVLPKLTGKFSLDVEAGYYGIAVTPQNALEKEMRLMRTEPTHSETSLDVFGDMTVKFELLPPYEKIQCIGYFMRTGAYIGVDNVVTGVASTGVTVADDRRKKQRIEALNDIDGRCEIMKDAVVKAFATCGKGGTGGMSGPPGNGWVKTGDPKILKVFMAPEFYFRGQLGAYPLETMSEILTPPKDPVMANIVALKAELDDPKYNDWLFVLGSAIGAIELDADIKRTSVDGLITLIEPAVKVYGWTENSLSGSALAAGWKLYQGDSATHHAITAVAVKQAEASFTRQELEFAADLIIPDETKFAVGTHGTDTVTFIQKQGTFEIDCPLGAPLIGQHVKDGAILALIDGVTPISGTSYEVVVSLAISETLAVGPAEVTVGITSKAVDIKALYNCFLFVKHLTGSVVANAAAGWRFWTKPAVSPWSVDPAASSQVIGAGSFTTDELWLSFPDIPVWSAGDTLTLGDLCSIVDVTEEKLVTIEVQFTGATAIAKGHFFEVGGEAKGLVESSTDLSANKHRLSIWLPMSAAHGLSVTNAVTLSTAGTAEILNTALVRKGGTVTPVRADGGAQKELLVYKESLSSVDFAGMDYGRGAFDSADRRAISLYGDPARRVTATVGATGSMGTSKNEPGTLTPSGVRITETNRSGLGGGSIFTMDGITFGLEVCLDHSMQKLVGYFKGLPKRNPPVLPAAVAGEPMIEVQLIPSCGMKIEDESKYTVADGIIFNVDAHHFCGCQKDGGGAAAPLLGWELLAPPTAATYFETGETAQSGFIEVFEEIDKPTKTPFVP